ncbi:MAG: 50S ribosomal protein L25 [Verrucomicrobia bacterium]|nr:50S ribosomal protein L25 [Verrucomicrobiota bacterium]
MKSVSLTAYPRALTRRAGLKKVRANSRVPAIIYGRHHPPQNLEINLKEIEDLIHHSMSENILVDLSVQNDAKARRLALVQEVQHHPLSGKVLHIDLHEVVENEKVTVMVPVETAGEAVGVKTGGGVLEHVRFRLRVRALPKDLPEYIQVDVSHMEVGHSIHIGDIKPPENAEILGDKKIVVISVALPKTEAQEAAEAAAAEETPAEPEMIREKKEEGAAAPAEKGAEKGQEKTADKKAPEKAPEKGAEKPAEKAEKKPEKKK